MNRKGANVIGVTLIVVLLLLAVGGIGFVVYKSATAPSPQEQVGSGFQNSSQNANPSGTGTPYIVATNPTVQIVGQDKAVQGTTVGTSSNQYAVNNGAFGSVTLGTTTAVPGQAIDLLLLNGTTYHSAYYGNAQRIYDASGNIINLQSYPSIQQIDSNPQSPTYNQVVTNSISVQPGSFPVTVSFNKNASVSITAFNNNNAVIDGSATNYTVSAGQSASITFRMQGSQNANTQAMNCVLEETNKTAINTQTGLSMTGGTGASLINIPTNFYSPAGTSSVLAEFAVNAISDAENHDFTLSVPISNVAGSTLSNSKLIVSCYSREIFLDSNNRRVTYDIQDSAGNLKSMATYTKTIPFT